MLAVGFGQSPSECSSIVLVLALLIAVLCDSLLFWFCNAVTYWCTKSLLIFIRILYVNVRAHKYSLKYSTDWEAMVNTVDCSSSWVQYTVPRLITSIPAHGLSWTRSFSSASKSILPAHHLHPWAASGICGTITGVLGKNWTARRVCSCTRTSPHHHGNSWTETWEPVLVTMAIAEHKPEELASRVWTDCEGWW